MNRGRNQASQEDIENLTFRGPHPADNTQSEPEAK